MITNLPVRTAAEHLGVSAARVRALIAAGLLEATKVGDRWLVDPESVERRAKSHAKPGRPLDATKAWALLLLASGEETAWLTPRQRSLLRRRLREKPFEASLSGLGRRAAVHRMRAHPADLERIAREPGLVRTGVSAAIDHGVGLVAPDELDVYVGGDRFRLLARKYSFQPSRRPNLVLRVVEGRWPFPKGAGLAPRAIVAADLLESSDARTHRAGRALVARMGLP